MKIKFVFLIVACLYCSLASYSATPAMHPTEQVNFVKKQVKLKKEPYYSAYLQLIHSADSLLDMSHHALVDFAVPGYYDKPEAHRANSLALQADAFGAYCTALAYRLSGNKKYALKACYFLDNWAAINKKYSEHDGVLVMSYSGSGLLIAAELMGDEKIWKKDAQMQFANWVRQVYSRAANEICGHKNNWADWGRFGSLLAAAFLKDNVTINADINLIKTDLFEKIALDGHMPEEVKRGANGIWYTYFSLAPMTASCWLIYNLTGENLFELEQNGTSIKKALDYLFYYNQHPRQWTWFADPHTGTNESWPQNLFEAMSGIYCDAEYEGFVKPYRPIIYPVHHFAWSFPTLMPVRIHGF